jgi:Domain of unknown function (DUF4145)
MASWWDLGEHSGYRGTDLAHFEITCPFCFERGNFEVIHRVSKKKPNSDKRLNFDTLKCGNCAGYVMVFWSAGQGLHDFHTLPWPRRYDRALQHWPEDVGRYWLQAKRNLADENWDAAALMARSALQLSLRAQGAEGKNLKEEINQLAESGVLPLIISEWSKEVRELGNDAAHPRPGQAATNPKDAHDVVKFLDFFLRYLFTLPHEIEEYRARER